MSEIRRESILKRYTNINELSESDRALLQEAKNAVETSYAPYSNFHVGCALQLNNGVIVKGSNLNFTYKSLRILSVAFI